MSGWVAVQYVLRVVTVRRNPEVALFIFVFQAEDGIRDLVRSRGLGDVYKRQATHRVSATIPMRETTSPVFPTRRRVLTDSGAADRVAIPHPTTRRSPRRLPG